MTSNSGISQNAYGAMRAFYAGSVPQWLINKHLPADLYATATRGEIAGKRLLMIKELADV